MNDDRVATYARLFTGLAAVCVAGCGGEKPAPRPVEAAKHPPKTTMVLNWFPEAEHGGFFAAQAHGYFAEEGVDVEILPGGPGSAVVPRVATGQVNFGVENADHVVLGQAQQADVVAVMAPIPVSPRCIMVHADSGITNLYGLRDMKLAMNAAGAFARYLQKTVPLPGVRIVPYAGNVSQFVLDKSLAQQAYVFSEPFAARAAGVESRALLISGIGFNPYTSCLLTSGRLIRERPALVGAVVRASQRGWAQYLRDPGATHARIHERNPELGLDLLAFGQAELQKLCQPDPGSTIPAGGMTLERWNDLCRQLAEIGLINAGAVDPATCFDAQFLRAGE